MSFISWVMALGCKAEPTSLESKSGSKRTAYFHACAMKEALSVPHRCGAIPVRLPGGDGCSTRTRREYRRHKVAANWSQSRSRRIAAFVLPSTHKRCAHSPQAAIRECSVFPALAAARMRSPATLKNQVFGSAKVPVVTTASWNRGGIGPDSTPGTAS